MRNVTDAFIAACNAPQTEEGFFVLVTIDHPNLPGPIYLNNSGANIISRGMTFLACPIQPTISDDSDDRPPQAKLILDNVDRDLVGVIREAAADGIALTVTLEIIKATDPDTVEQALTDFEMKDVMYNSLTIEGTLSLEGLFAEPACAYTFSPTYCPGLF